MPFTLRRATAADAPALTAVYQSSFSTDAIGKLVFPRTEATTKFWTASVLEEIQHPNYHFICIVSKEDGSDEEKIVAYAKWNDPGAPHPDPKDLPQWPEGGDHELGDYFFGTLFTKHNEILGERKHWYLEILAVANEYQGKGCGGMLIKWALEKADATGDAVFLEASPAGAPIYKRYGFEEVYKFVVDLRDKNASIDEYEELFMLREPKKS